MDWLPWDTLLLILLVDLLLWIGVSAACGVLVARAVGSSIGRGVLIGTLLPGLGPFIWAVIAVGRESSLLRAGWASGGPALRYVGAGMLTLAALLFVLATPSPWGEIEGGVERYSLAGDTTASDTPVGITVMVGTILLLLGAALLLAVTTARTRAALIAAFVGTIWATVTVDGLLAFSAIADLSIAADDASGGYADVSVGAAGGLWFALGGSLLALSVAALTALHTGTEEEEQDLFVPVPVEAPPPSSEWATDWGGSDTSRWDKRDGF